MGPRLRIEGKWPAIRFGWRALPLVLPAALALNAAPKAATAEEWRKLTQGAPFSDVLPTPEFITSLNAPTISPDGRWVVFWHDRDVDESYELFSAAVDGSASPQRISGPLPPYGANGFQISTNGSRVFYLAAQDTAGVFEAYSVPIAGGVTTKLNGPLVQGGNVVMWRITPASDRLIYLADQEVDEVYELYSVPIGGGTAVKLNGVLAPGGDVEVPQVEVTADHAVYLADQEVDEVYELYSVPIGGGTAVKLNAPLARGRDVSFFQVSPAGDRVVFWADHDTNNVFELYSVPITGGVPVKLHNPLGLGDYVLSVRFTPAGDRVIYPATQDTPGVLELYSVPTVGGAPVKLSGGGFVGIEILMSSKGDRVVYEEGTVIGGTDSDPKKLRSVAVTGGPPVELTADYPAGFSLSPDGEWVLYQSVGQSGALSLWRVPAAGPPGDKEFLTDLPLSGFGFDPRGDWLVLLSKGRLDSVVRPWRVRLLDPVPFAEELVDESFFQPDGDAVGLNVGSDGSIVYIADQDTDEEYELYSIPMPLFADGFESGDISAWSSAVP